MMEEIWNLARKFRGHWKNYVGQSLLATGIFAAILLGLNVQIRPIITASIGATAFIVFAIPSDVTASPRNIIGGHAIGVFSGILMGAIGREPYLMVSYSLAVGLSIFIMVVTDCEHPPASGTALGLTVSGASPEIIISLMILASSLALVHILFRPYLRDLR